MSRIAIDARMINTSTGRYIERLLEYLQQIDETNHYFVLMQSKDFDFWLPRAKNFTRIVSDYPSYSFSEQINFAIQLYRLNLDLVHFTMPQHPLLYLKKHIITIHDLTLVSYINRRPGNPLSSIYKYWLKPKIFSLSLKMSVKRASRIITDTDYVKDQIVQKYKMPAEKISRIYLAADPVSNHPSPVPELTNKRFILYVGNAYKYKNVSCLLRAFKDKADKDLSLVVAGKPDYFYTELQKEAQKLGLRNVLFPGFVEDNQLIWLYQNATLFVHPSFSEGFGFPGLEAMGSGLPVVAASASCLPEVYGDAAVYFNPSRPKELTQLINELAKDPKRLGTLREAGHKRASQFSWKRTAKETLAIYKGCI